MDPNGGYEVTSSIDGNALLMGGEKTKACSFDGEPVITWSGMVLDPPSAVQSKNYDTDEPEFWPDGKPKMQVVVKLQTDVIEGDDDTGVRSLWLKGESQKAVVTAIRAAGASTLERGGFLTIAYYAKKENPPEPGKKKRFPTKLYRANYMPPASQGNQALMAAQPESVDFVRDFPQGGGYSAGPPAEPVNLREVAAQQSAVLARMKAGPQNHQGNLQSNEAPF